MPTFGGKADSGGIQASVSRLPLVPKLTS